MTTNEAWSFLRNNNLFGGSSDHIKKCKEAYGVAVEDLAVLRFGLRNPPKPKTYTEADIRNKITPWRIIELYHKCNILQNALTFGLDIV